jgi:hypothetical protein
MKEIEVVVAREVVEVERAERLRREHAYARPRAYLSITDDACRTPAAWITPCKPP